MTPDIKMCWGALPYGKAAPDLRECGIGANRPTRIVCVGRTLCGLASSNTQAHGRLGPRRHSHCFFYCSLDRGCTPIFGACGLRENLVLNPNQPQPSGINVHSNFSREAAFPNLENKLHKSFCRQCLPLRSGSKSKISRFTTSERALATPPKMLRSCRNCIGNWKKQ